MKKFAKMAFDVSSVRSKDENGYLRVDSSHITKEVVSPYYGREIINAEENELEPDRIYYGWRKGEEIQAGMKTFEGIPILLGHHEDSAENPQKQYRVGSTGTDAKWNAPYLDNSLFITDEEAIKAIEDGSSKELSCGYTYTPIFEDGSFQGEHYDFIMTNIRGNHIALVERGRVGHDVKVADSLENLHKTNNNNNFGGKMSKKSFSKATVKARDENIEEKIDVQDESSVDKIGAILKDLLTSLDEDKAAQILSRLSSPAGDENLDNPEPSPEPEQGKEVLPEGEMKDEEGGMQEEQKDPITASETLPEEDQEKVEIEVEQPVAEAEPELEKQEAVQDEGEEVDKALEEAINAAANEVGMEADELFHKVFMAGVAYCKGNATDEKPEEIKEQENIQGDACMAKDTMPNEMKKSEKSFARDEAISHMKKLAMAGEEVKPVLGSINAFAFDSAEAIYGAALRKCGIDTGKHPKSAYKSMFEIVNKQRSSRMAKDSVIETPKKFDGVFAGLNTIKHN